VEAEAEEEIKTRLNENKHKNGWKIIKIIIKVHYNEENIMKNLFLGEWKNVFILVAK
jgi:hypothetical protein